MSLGEVIQTTYGQGGYQPQAVSGNVVEQHVVTADDGVTQTITVQDGTGRPTGRTYPLVRDRLGENTTALQQRAAAALNANAAWLNRGAAPNLALAVAHLDRLTKQVNALLRVFAGRVDDISDT